MLKGKCNQEGSHFRRDEYSNQLNTPPHCSTVLFLPSDSSPACRMKNSEVEGYFKWQTTQRAVQDYHYSIPLFKKKKLHNLAGQSAKNRATHMVWMGPVSRMPCQTNIECWFWRCGMLKTERVLELGRVCSCPHWTPFSSPI